MIIKGGYKEFADALGQRESAGRYDIKNSLGFLGKWQFGKPRLWDLGLSIGGWVPRGGQTKLVVSEADFLSNKELQDNIFILHVIDLKRRIEKNFSYYSGKAFSRIKEDNHYELIPYDGEGHRYLDDYEIIPLTISGLIGGVHLLGFGSDKSPGLRQYLEKNIVNKDAFGTSIEDYIILFSDYDLANIPIPLKIG